MTHKEFSSYFKDRTSPPASSNHNVTITFNGDCFEINYTDLKSLKLTNWSATLLRDKLEFSLMNIFMKYVLSYGTFGYLVFKISSVLLNPKETISLGLFISAIVYLIVITLALVVFPAYIVNVGSYRDWIRVCGIRPDGEQVCVYLRDINMLHKGKITLYSGNTHIYRALLKAKNGDKTLVNKKSYTIDRAKTVVTFIALLLPYIANTLL